MPHILKESKRSARRVERDPVLTGSAFCAEPVHLNILLIYADDVGYGDLSCYGAAKDLTAKMDELATQELRFTDTYADVKSIVESPCRKCPPALINAFNPAELSEE